MDGRLISHTDRTVERYRVDPVSLVEVALTAGAAAGVKDVASVAVTDAYAGLKAKVKQRFAGRPAAELVLAEHEADPRAWKGPLAAELATTGVDDEMVAAAQALMTLIDEAGSQTGKYAVTVQDSQGVQIGDHNTQTNTFGPRPI